MHWIRAVFAILVCFTFGIALAARAGSPQLYEALASPAGRFVLSELGLGEQMVGRGAAYYARGGLSDADPVETIFERVRLRFLVEHPERARLFADPSRAAAFELGDANRALLRSMLRRESDAFFKAHPLSRDFRSARTRFLAPSPQEAWISRTRFVPMGNDQVLSLVRREASRLASIGRKPAVIIDLDETGLENRTSAAALLLGPGGWVESAESAAFPRVREALRALPLGRMQVSPLDIFREAGIADELVAIKSVEAFLRARVFLNDNAALYGTTMPGFVAYARSLLRAGARVVYLTGRAEPQQGEGTRATLRLLGVPLDDGATLVMKPGFIRTDEFKLRAVRELVEREGIDPVAMIDNEPENLIAVQSGFPGMKAVFMDTQFNHLPPVPGHGFYRIRRW